MSSVFTRILTRKGHVLRWLAAALLTFAVSAPAAADVEDAMKRIARDGHARVLVRMKTDAGLANWAPTQPASRQRAAVAAAIENTQPALRRARIANMRTFSTLPFVAATVTREQILELVSAPEVEQVFLVQRERKQQDAPALYRSRETIQLATSVPSIDVLDAWAKGYDGTGYAVAVIDDGFNLNHPMLRGKNVGDACFSPTYGTTTKTNCPSGQYPEIGAGAASNCPVGRCNHGTSVASIAVGNDGINYGVARGAKLVPIDVFSTETSVTECAPEAAPCELTDSVTVLDALNYVNENAAALKIAAVNLSFGGIARDGYCDDDPRKGVIDMLRQKGIAVAAAASNEGLTGKISPPACISSAIGVGATNDGTTVATFSNFAATLDMMAPGVSIQAASGSGAGVATTSGTSAAAPHVAGAWAVMRSAFPQASFDQLETALKQTGLPVTRPGAGVTLPKIQVMSAINRLQGRDRRLFNNMVSSNAPALGQSFLRFFNNSSTAGTVTVTLRDSTSGVVVGAWTSPVIPPQASPQIAVESIERETTSVSGLPVRADRTYYNIDVTSTFRGYMQHVLWARAGGVFANLSSCASGFADDASVLLNVHASTNSSYGSRIRIVNTGANPDVAQLAFYNPVSGAEIARWSSPEIAPGASLEVTADDLEAQVGALRLSGDTLLQYNVRLSNLSGYLQHVVDNNVAGALVDMSSKCDLGVASN